MSKSRAAVLAASMTITVVATASAMSYMTASAASGRIPVAVPAPVEDASVEDIAPVHPRMRPKDLSPVERRATPAASKTRTVNKTDTGHEYKMLSYRSVEDKNCLGWDKRGRSAVTACGLDYSKPFGAFGGTGFSDDGPTERVLAGWAPKTATSVQVSGRGVEEAIVVTAGKRASDPSFFVITIPDTANDLEMQVLDNQGQVLHTRTFKGTVSTRLQMPRSNS